MVAKQVIFDYSETEDFVPTGGIAIYEDYGQGRDYPALELLGVFCGDCGIWIPADDEYLDIIAVRDEWWPMSEEIDNCIRPDGTRGFRPDNQIRMELD